MLALDLKRRYGSLELQCVLLQMDNAAFVSWTDRWRKDLVQTWLMGGVGRPPDGMSAALLQRALDAARA